MKNLEKIPVENQVYVDESGIDQFIHRPFARAPIGKKILGMISGKRYYRESFVAAKIKSKIIAPFCYNGTCDTTLFNIWIEKFLIPELKPGQVIIMDNASFHKSQKTKELLESVGCTILFLPPYSPDLNPIEIFWANFKKLVQKNLMRFKKLSHAIDKSFLICTS